LDPKKSKLPVDMWLTVGKYLLPNSASRELTSYENRSSFVKHYLMDSLAAYGSSFFNTSHKNRALSLREAIKKGSKPDAILINQVFMSRHLNTTPYDLDSILKYQQPFRRELENPEDKNFDSLLCEGYSLVRPMQGI
jgi:hypothetical protein